jgi:zinc/manganese transport system ATP-binding protein
MNAPAGDAIRFENLTLGYDRHPAIHHLDGAVARGALLAIVGPNGAGKSTLLKGIIGALRPLDGRIRLAGAKREAIAYLPQQTDIDRSFPISVFDVIAVGLWRQIGSWRAVDKTIAPQVDAAIAAVGLTGFERRPIGSLSGGETQRALFARLMLQDAPIILLDEPFNSIDARTTADLMALVHRWHEERRTILVVLHDLEQVRRHFPQTLLLARQAIAWGATTSVLSAPNLAKARHLCEAWDETAEVCERAGAAE